MHIPTLIQLAVILMTVVTFVMVAVWRANPQIPGVLTSGNHAAIDRWRREEAEALTRARRPDLLSQPVTK